MINLREFPPTIVNLLHHVRGSNRRATSLSVLITNLVMNGRTGTEILTRDLALGLLRRGHRPIVYTTAAGAIADELRRASVPVATEIDKIAEPIDVIHGHHTPCAAVAITRFPTVAAIFVCHDFYSWQDVPPSFPSIKRYVAVDTNVALRLTSEHGIRPETITIVLNGVDISRFLPGPPLPSKPKRALAFAKHPGHVEQITEACKRCDIKLDIVGVAVRRIENAPERILGDYDLVFASALSALEAMVCGRAVIVCDGRGLAGLVTPDRFQAWRPMNFGFRTLIRKNLVEDLITEIGLYDPNSAAVVGAHARAQASLDGMVSNYVALYSESIASGLAGKQSGQELALATARHLERWSPRTDAAWPWMIERKELLERIDELSGPLRLRPAYPWTSISFGTGEIQYAYRLSAGFYVPESGGVWTVEESATLLVSLPEEMQGDVLASFEVMAFIPPKSPPMNVTVFMNGEQLETWSFDAACPNGVHPTEVLLPGRLARQQDGWFAFKIEHPRTPLEYGLGEDRRPLGIFLKTLVFKPKP